MDLDFQPTTSLAEWHRQRIAAMDALRKEREASMRKVIAIFFAVLLIGIPCLGFFIRYLARS